MNSSEVRGKMPVFLVALLILSSVVAAGVYSRSSRSQKKPKGHSQTYKADTVTVAPEVLSKVEGLEISSVILLDQGTPNATLAIDVTNHRDQAVMALDFVSGRPETTSSGIAFDGRLAYPSRGIIRPHTVERFTWHLGSVMQGETVFLAAAIFSDGKEEGEQSSLETIKHKRPDSHPTTADEKPKYGGPQ